MSSTLFYLGRRLQRASFQTLCAVPRYFFRQGKAKKRQNSKRRRRQQKERAVKTILELVDNMQKFWASAKLIIMNRQPGMSWTDLGKDGYLALLPVLSISKEKNEAEKLKAQSAKQAKPKEQTPGHNGRKTKQTNPRHIGRSCQTRQGFEQRLQQIEKNYCWRGEGWKSSSSFVAWWRQCCKTVERHQKLKAVSKLRTARYAKQ